MTALDPCTGRLGANTGQGMAPKRRQPRLHAMRRRRAAPTTLMAQNGSGANVRDTVASAPSADGRDGPHAPRRGRRSWWLLEMSGLIAVAAAVLMLAADLGSVLIGPMASCVFLLICVSLHVAVGGASAGGRR